MNRKQAWRIPYYLEFFLFGDRGWGWLRLLATILLIILTVMLYGLAFELPAIDRTVSLWTMVLPNLSYVPEQILYIPASLMTLQSWRFLVVPLLAVWAALLAGALYIQDIYELDGFVPALKYLVASGFAIGYPRLRIDQGKKVIKPNEINLLDKIGGPGYVDIATGNVVLFERLNGPSNVRAAGRHFAGRFETIKEIASLDDQHGYADSLQAVTKDGIEVRVREVYYRYRLRTGQKAGGYSRRTPENPYPFSPQAVRNMAYNRLVKADGLTSWHDTVGGVINGIISDYVSKHQFDHLTVPRYHEKDPRAEISKEINGSRTRERLKDLGAELLWFDIGHFEAADSQIAEQRWETWQARWIGDGDVQQAYGEAQRKANQERGKAEAESEILISILHSLEDVDLSNDPVQILRNIILVRTAQVLEAMTEQQKIPPGM